MADHSGVSETGVVFFRAGGHSHDGINSSLIDYTKYSMFDFSVGIKTDNGDTTREYIRNINKQTFNQYISSFIASQVLEPAGIVLGENTIKGINIGAQEITADKILANSITAGQIAAGTITATQLSSNIILVNNTIKSNNYVANSAGWAIFSNGYAEFRNAIVSGNVVTSNIVATGGTIANWTINATSLTSNTGLSGLYANGYIVGTGSSFTDVLIAGASTTISSAGGGTIGQLSINAGSIAGTNTAISTNAIYALNANTGVAINGSTLALQFKRSGSVVGQIQTVFDPSANTYYMSYEADYHAFPSTSKFNILPVGTGTVSFNVKLQTTGAGSTIVADANNNFYKLTSRRSLKYDIVPVSDAINKLKLMNPVNFKWRLNKNNSELSLFLKDKDIKYGFIVEEIEQIDSSLINYSYVGPDTLSDDQKFDDPTNFEPESYDTNGIISILTAALKEAVERIENLESLNGV